ncbi:MAG: flagellum-specific ATP synthase FliI, partial [Paracoccus sp. (in: a-proteobacteria)]
MDKIESIVARIRNLRPAQYYGQVQQMRAGLISVEGLNGHASVGDRVLISLQKGCVAGEIVGLAPDVCDVLPEGNADGLSVGAEVELLFAPTIA